MSSSPQQIRVTLPSSTVKQNFSIESILNLNSQEERKKITDDIEKIQKAFPGFQYSSQSFNPIHITYHNNMNNGEEYSLSVCFIIGYPMFAPKAVIHFNQHQYEVIVDNWETSSQNILTLISKIINEVNHLKSPKLLTWI